jgi:hypothetical protein
MVVLTRLHRAGGPGPCSGSTAPGTLCPLRDIERMPDVFDIYTIIFLALAVFIFLRLRSVLGQRTGRERPPYDPYSARDAVRSPASDKVVTLPPRGPDAVARPSETAAPPLA